jgi:predicted dinucleotide-binding enzyme
MNIGILGSGDVAKTLAAGFLKHGHNTMLGSRDSAKLKDWAAAHPGGRIGSFSDAADFGAVIVLAVKGTASVEAVRTAGAARLAGKTVIDATNPIADAPPSKGVLGFFTNLNSSLMEQLQQTFPDVNFVKAFNSVGAACMVNPSFKGGRPSMFICGNNAPAKQTVAGLLDQFGWDAEDMGGAEAARAIEPLCMLWCIPGFLHNDWVHAFKMLR